MFGLSIVSTDELKRLQDVDDLFSTKMGEKVTEIFNLNEQIKSLLEKLAKFDRKRVNGKFVKTTN